MVKAKPISDKVRSLTPQIGDVIRVRYHDGDQSVIGLEGEVITDPDLDNPPLLDRCEVLKWGSGGSKGS